MSVAHFYPFPSKKKEDEASLNYSSETEYTLHGKSEQIHHQWDT